MEWSGGLEPCLIGLFLCCYLFFVFLYFLFVRLDVGSWNMTALHLPRAACASAIAALSMWLCLLCPVSPHFICSNDSCFASCDGWMDRRIELFVCSFHFITCRLYCPYEMASPMFRLNVGGDSADDIRLNCRQIH